MSNSLRTVANCGLFLAILDLIHALSTFGFYCYELIIHYRCHWNHGIRWCQYYLNDTNHSLRVNIGIGEGVVCIFFASVLIAAFCRYNPWVAWLWLIKALAVIGINAYFIGVWMVQRSRYYHSLWNPKNYNQDEIFLMAGIGLTAIELLIMFIFFCVSGAFTYKVKRQQVPTMESDI
ncbi:uncharacterized protein [Palaemon carinicauda]|uniref:uncharacterized protein n=1 Tax=Palaemon carinicauda TaxID=392227 RepID=UPI0035B60AE8